MRVARVLPRIAVASFTVMLAAGLAPQSGTADKPQYGESIEVQLHNLDAVVTDRDGKPVPGLKMEDFVLLENGVPQAITNFSAYDERPAAGPAAMALPPTGTVRDVPAEPETVAPAASAPPPRRFVFFIDEMSIQGAARKKLKQNSAALLRQMRPGDVATVVRPTGTTKIEQPYTSDAAAVERSLNKAIDSCRISITAPAFRELELLRRALQQADTSNEVQAAKRDYVNRATGRVEQRLGQLRALVASMSGGEGKKILVIITSGLSAKPGEEAYTLGERLGIFENVRHEPTREEIAAEEAKIASGYTGPQEGTPGRLSSMLADVKAFGPQSTWEGMNRARGGDFKTMIDNFARTAAAEGVTIYALEPEVPLMLDISRGADSATEGSTLLGNDVRARYTMPPELIGELLHHEGDTLTSMTEKTGGRWFRGIGSIDETFQQVNDDLQVYYSLAYRARGGDGKPRRLQLTVKNRPDLKVRTRSETVDPTRSKGMADRVVAELVFPGQVNDLQMTVKAEPPQRDGRMFIVPVEVVIPVEKITFVRSATGTYLAKVSLHYATAIDRKEFVSYGRQEQIIELSGQQYAEQKRIRYRYTSNITVPKGNVRIALGVTDTTSSASSLQTLAVKAQ
jgi:VWFA-related protein